MDSDFYCIRNAVSLYFSEQGFDLSKVFEVNLVDYILHNFVLWN